MSEWGADGKPIRQVMGFDGAPIAITIPEPQKGGGQLVYSSLIAFCGDSITRGSNSTNAAVYSFIAVIFKLIGYLVSSKSINAGVAGDRSDQLLARMDSIIALGARVLSVMIGTNDAAQNVPLATYQANIIAIKAKADAAGIPIIFCLIPPRGAAAPAGSKDTINKYNLWLRFWCAQNGIPLADTFSVLVDKTTGSMDAAYDSDSTHPNNAGHQQIARAIADVLVKVLPKMPWPVATKGVGLVSNPLMVDTTGWTTIAGNTATKTVVVPTDNVLPAGNWLRFGLDNTAGGTTVSTTQGLTMDTAQYAVGDVLLFSLYVNPSGSGKVQLNVGATATSVPYDSLISNNPVPLMIKATVPSGGTFRLAFVFSCAPGENKTFDVGAINVFNLTAMGLTDITV